MATLSPKEKLEALKGAFAKKTSGDGDQNWKLYFNFWKAEVGSVSTVRFLPDLDENNSLGFLVENFQHELTINGQRKKVPCLSMYGEDCPICALSRKYYDEKTPEGEAMGKSYYRKKSYIGQVIVIDSPIEHDQAQLVKLIEFGPQVFKQVQAAFQSGDLEEAPYEFKGGYNFRFRKTKTGSGQNSYDTSNFAPKQSDLEDEVIDQLNLYNLSDYRTKQMDRATMEAMLVAHQTGTAMAEAATPKEQAPKADPAPAPAHHAAKAEAAPEAPKAEAAEEAVGMSVMERLRARAAAKAAEAAK